MQSNVNNVKHKASRHFRIKRRYLKAELNEL